MLINQFKPLCFSLLVLLLSFGIFSNDYAMAEYSQSKNTQLLFSPEELPAIREKVKQGRSKEIMDAARKIAAMYSDLPTNPYAPDGPYTGRNLLTHVGSLGLVGWIDENEHYKQKAKAILFTAIRQWSQADYEKWNGHLSTGDAAIAMAIGYDLVSPLMNDLERQEIKKELEEFGAYLLDDSIKKPKAGGIAPVGSMVASRLMHNHQVVVHAGLYLCGVVLGKQNWVNHAALRIRGYLFYFQDGTGAPLEGIGYAGYGLEVSAIANFAGMNAGQKDMFAGIRGLRDYPRFVLYHTVPKGGEVIPQNQTGPRQNIMAGMYYLVNHFNDPQGLYAWENIVLTNGSYILPEQFHTSHKNMMPLVLLSLDNTLKSQTPKQAGLSEFGSWYRGQTSVRGEWGDADSAMMTFQCTRNTVGGWDHTDEGSFTFSAFGSNFLIDPSHTFTNGEHHSVILIDGVSQHKGGGGLWSEGMPEAAEDRGDSYYMAGDSAHAYRIDSWLNDSGLKVQKARRQILFVPNAPAPYAIISDRVIMDDSQEHEYTWRGIFADIYTPNNVEIGSGQNKALIKPRSGKGVAAVQMIQPQGAIFEVGTTKAKDRTINFLDGKAPAAKEANFITVVSAAENEEQLPRISKAQKSDLTGVMITFNDGTSHSIQVSEENILKQD